MNRIRQSADYTSQADACSEDAHSRDVCPEFELSFDINSALFSPATSDSPQAVFAPLHYEPKYPYPLIVWLHGPGGDQRQLLRIMPMISLRNYLAVAPQGILTQPQEDYRWEQTTAHIDQAEQRIFDSIESVTGKYNFSHRKIFLAGFDCGGTMALRVAMNNPSRFAGAISLGGPFPQGPFPQGPFPQGPFPRGQQPLGNLAAARRLPVFLAAGRKSKTYAEAHVCSDLRLLHSAGISITLRQYPCAQEISPQMLQDVDRWIIEQITTTTPSVAEAGESRK